MTARRILAGLALLLAACTTTACAQVVTGSGSGRAPDLQGGTITASPTGGPTPTGSDSSSDPTSPAASPSSSADGAGGDDDPSPVCKR